MVKINFVLFLIKLEQEANKHRKNKLLSEQGYPEPAIRVWACWCTWTKQERVKWRSMSKQNRRCTSTSCGHCNTYMIICWKRTAFVGCCTQSDTHQWGLTNEINSKHVCFVFVLLISLMCIANAKAYDGFAHFIHNIHSTIEWLMYIDIHNNNGF